MLSSIYVVSPALAPMHQLSFFACCTVVAKVDGLFQHLDELSGMCPLATWFRSGDSVRISVRAVNIVRRSIASRDRGRRGINGMNMPYICCTRIVEGVVFSRERAIFRPSTRHVFVCVSSMHPERLFSVTRQADEQISHRC